MSSARADAADASPTWRAKAMTIQAASIAPARIATRRRVMPTIGSAARSGCGSAPVGARRRPRPGVEIVGGVVGGSRLDRRDIAASVADVPAGVSTERAVTAELSNERVDRAR